LPPPSATSSPQPWADEQQLTRDTHDKLTKQLSKLDAREQRLIDLAADGILARAKILERSNAIQLERSRIQASLTDISAELALGADRLRACLDLVSDPATLYRDAPDDTRRQLNSTFYRRFYLDDEPLAVTDDELNPPFEEIQDANAAYQRYKQLTVGQRPNKPAMPAGSQTSRQ
jgi:site-specific DNA recombinase